MKTLLCTAAVAGLIGITPFSHGEDVVKTTAAVKADKKPGAKSDSNSKTKGLDLNGGTTGPITTEIYADEAFFDSNKSVGIFRGHVKVSDPRFNLQSDKLTTFISKGQTAQAAAQSSPAAQASPAETGQTGQGQGLEKAIAEGNVAVVRDRPDPNGGPPSHAVGRAETATYVASTGDVELKGNPRVQQGLNTHIATSPETVMVINQSGQLTTHGPSRTEIRQEPKDEKDGGKEEHKAKPESSPKT
jgi:lipopolysaccharide export system protein LptA